MEHTTRNKKKLRLFYVPCYVFHKSGFTLLEVTIVSAIIIIISAIAIPSVTYLTRDYQLANAFQETISKLRVAQNKTLSSEDSSQFGIYFDTTVSPHQYILFKGASYATKDLNYDVQITSLPSAVEFSSINLGGGSEAVFDRLTGSTSNTGDITLRLTDDTSKTKTFYIDNSGAIGLVALAPPDSSNRITDWRHVLIDYNGRNIDTALENIVLLFDGAVLETIPISENLINGQIDWEDTITANGTDQTVRIHTLKLNDNLQTQFSIFRDRRFNDKSLRISLSLDLTGSLAEYSADGLAAECAFSPLICSTYVTGFNRP